MDKITKRLNEIEMFWKGGEMSDEEAEQALNLRGCSPICVANFVRRPSPVLSNRRQKRKRQHKQGNPRANRCARDNQE
jgi:hypothetical protein